MVICVLLGLLFWWSTVATPNYHERREACYEQGGWPVAVNWHSEACLKGNELGDTWKAGL